MSKDSDMADVPSEPKVFYTPKNYRAVRLETGGLRPEGSYLMTKDEVVTMQRKRLKNWKPQSDVYPFKYGGSVLASSSAMTGLLMNTYFRNKFHLKNYGMMKTLAPVVIFPTAVSLVLQVFNQNNVLTNNDCATCLCVRGGIYQVVAAVGYTSCVAPLLCIQLSRHFHTYVMPKRAFKPDFRYALKTRPSGVYSFLTLCWCNFAVGVLVTYKQGRAMDKITEKEAAENAKNLMNI